MRGKDALKNIIFELCNQFIIIIRGLIIPRLIINVYGSSVNGLLCSITNFLSYITLLDVGLSVVINHHLYKSIADKDREKTECILLSASKFFKRISFVFVFYIILLLFIYPIIINNYDWKFTDSLIIIIALSIFFEYYFGITNSLYIKAIGKSYVLSIANILLNIISSLIIIILINNNSNIILIKIISSLVFIIKPLFFYFYVKRFCHINIKNAKNEYVISDKRDGVSQHIAWVIFRNMDVVILTLFSTLINVSIYSIYASICACIRCVCRSITSGIDATFGNIIASGEKKILNDKFNMYEILFFTIITVIFSCALQTFIPFVKIYTRGINDVNYINPVLGVWFILSEFILALRLPYRALIYSAGHFKETKIGAWIECILNVSLSIIFIIKWGIVGVIIATFISMFYRTSAFIYHANKKILNRSLFISIKKIILVFIESILVYYILNYVPFMNVTNYLDIVIDLSMSLIISSLLVIIINILFYKGEFKKSILYIKNIIFKEIWTK